MGPSVPWIGTTWIERGPRYWWRRVTLAAVRLALVSLGMVGLAVLPRAGDTPDTRLGRAVLLAVASVGGPLAGLWLWHRLDSAAARRPPVRHPRHPAPPGPGLGLLAGAGVPAAAAVLLLLAATLSSALFVVLFLRSLGGRLPEEGRAAARPPAPAGRRQ